MAALLLLPAAVIVFGVVLYPAGRALVISFYNVDSPFPGDYPFVGLDNYREVLADRRLWAAAGHTLYFTVASTALELVLGLGLATLLAAPMRLRWLFRAVVILPWALPTIVNGAMWRWILNAQYGVANAVLTQLHLQHDYRSWLGTSPFLALNMVVVADVWKNTSLVAFFLLAGLQTIPPGLYEAARVDGAGPVRSFFRITLPLLRPSIALCLIISVTGSLLAFDQFFILTNGGPDNSTTTVVMMIYREAFRRFDLGSAAALSVVVLIVLLVINIAQFRYLRSGADD